MNPRNVAILLFDEVEVLDFAGPFEVFAVANELHDDALFRVFTVAALAGPIRARNGLSVNPDYLLSSTPRPDVLIVPGGIGTRPLLGDETLLGWIAATTRANELTLSICSGALLLAKAGLLTGLKATTHHQVIALLREVAPDTEIVADVRYVDNGRIVTAAGISAGIDASLHVVRRLCGEAVSTRTAAYMEYGIAL
ncbi:MAG: DJ-1/PfpI family protein [Candidatus Competibacter sp.]|nr:DJ-1/PfpI family protein [Candidatus Competibacter sp.]MDG4604646.1 DJ-1/PfpI family protein [Candidatus Contendobacter sp.]HRD50704.1 DJ-1/PfpI family protein [Candidatus Contendobacter sp.]